MTDVPTLLAGIKTQSDGLTDLCAGHLQQSIRHVQRNCDIDCSAHEEDGTWSDCKQPDRYDGARMAESLASIPRLVAAIEAVEKVLDEKYRLWAAVCGNTCGKDITGIDHDAIADEVAAAIRAAVVTALGGEE